MTSNAARSNVFAFATNELAATLVDPPPAAATDVTRPPVTSSAAATDGPHHDETVAAPPIDRVFEYDRHFQLDEPFTIRLARGETVLLPLEPIHDQLFLSSPSPTHALANDALPLAIGLELSNCVGNVQSFVVLKSDVAQRISTASYQCVTLTHARAAQQELVNLCPHYDPAFPAAMRVDPAQVKGFVLRADVDAPVESIALLRSTKASSGFAKTFVVASDVEPSRAPFNVSFSYAHTTLGFESPAVWEHGASVAAAPTSGASNALASHASACKACEYVLLAEKLAPNPTSAMAASPEQLALPYCVWQRSSVQYQLPALALASVARPGGDAADAPTRHAVKLDDLFADRFRSSGEYRFVLLASLPRDANHHHAAMIAYAPQQLTVTVPPFYQSHFFIAFVAVALVALAAVVHVQYRPHRRFFRVRRNEAAASSDTEDASEAVSLLAHSAALSSPRAESMDSLERGLLADCVNDQGNDSDDGTEHGQGSRRNSLLEAIKRTKKEQPSGVQLDGYHEIF